jgi:hypothetical protein
MNQGIYVEFSISGKSVWTNALPHSMVLDDNSLTAMSSSFDFDFSFLFPQYEWNKMNKFQLKGSKDEFSCFGW